MFSTRKKIGVLGGGQLGRMLGQAASPLDLHISFLDTNRNFPAATVCKDFVVGDFKNYADVMAFGADKDVLTIEIEHVNTDALRALEAQGKQVHPRPDALDMIKDKGLQKQFYAEHQIPTAPFLLYETSDALRLAVQNGDQKLPFVQKTRTAGYDGKGVSVIRSLADLDSKLLSGACLTEKLIDFERELAVIAARNPSGEVRVFPCVEMDFHPEANLVEWVICPARISPLVAAQAEALAEQIIEAFDICGLLAVEFFLTKTGQLLVNEVAPRPHNSGHHTIDTAITSQYEQHLRAILDLPLGDTTQIRPAVMMNLLGAEGHTGPVQYAGMETALAIPEVYVHLYGKENTSPFRKMGHVTIAANNVEEAITKGKKVKETLKCQTSSF
jgi:5-(carboxyamino)imidazole ribonucleotide synthase